MQCTGQNNGSPTMQTMNGTLNSQAIGSRLQSFYQVVKNIKQGGTSSRQYTIDSSVYLIEGAYNYLSVELSDDEVATYRFSVTVPKTGNNVTAQNLSKAFYAIKDSLVGKQASLGTTEDALTHLDVSATVLGSSVRFNVSSSLLIHLLPTLLRCKDSVNNVNNRGFVIYNDWYFGGSYTRGQRLINMTTNTVIPGSIDNTKPGAASTIRSMGKVRYRGTCITNACEYYVNIVTNPEEGYQGNAISSPISPYVTAGISGYKNGDVFSTTRFFPWADTLCAAGMNYPNAVDPARDLKVYLTKPMVNFYIYRVPDIISANLPSGKTFYDLNIEWMYCLCCARSPFTYDNPDGWTLPFHSQSYNYYTSYGDKLNDCSRVIIKISQL